MNFASRLQHEAPPGGVLISFETYAHVLEIDANRMSDDERKSAAEALRRALERLERGGVVA